MNIHKREGEAEMPGHNNNDNNNKTPIPYCNNELTYFPSFIRGYFYWICDSKKERCHIEISLRDSRSILTNFTWSYWPCTVRQDSITCCECRTALALWHKWWRCITACWDCRSGSRAFNTTPRGVGVGSKINYNFITSFHTVKCNSLNN